MGLRQVLEALAEIAFAPQFFPGRIEKERRAVMAEAQMMNSIEYRVDCQLLQFLHQENALGSRFPIGKMDQARRTPGAPRNPDLQAATCLAHALITCMRMPLVWVRMPLDCVPTGQWLQQCR